MAMWFFCDDVSQDIVTGGFVPEASDAELQAVPAGQSMFTVPDGTIGNPFSATPDFTLLKAYLRNQINLQAESLFVQYATAIAGQDRRYLIKQQEAVAYTPGDEVANPANYPFMIAEAQIRTLVSGAPVTVATVQTEIMAQITESIAPEAGIEAYRVALRLQVTNATKLPTMVNAANQDWAAILTAILTP